MNPHRRRQAALVLIILSLIGWPLSAFLLAKDEPPFILALSWLAITITAVDVWLTTDVRKQTEEGDNE